MKPSLLLCLWLNNHLSQRQTRIRSLWCRYKHPSAAEMLGIMWAQNLCIHTLGHGNLLRVARLRAHTRTHKHRHTQAHKNTHIGTMAHKHALADTCRTHKHTCADKCAHTNTHAGKHAQKHTHTHVHTHKHTHKHVIHPLLITQEKSRRKLFSML